MFHRSKTETKDNNSGGFTSQSQKAAEVDKDQNQQDTNMKDTTMNNDTANKEDNIDRSMDIPGASPFAKSNQAPTGRMPGYPGGSSAPSYAGIGAAAAQSGRRLTVGPGITMSGEIESCDHLVVEGTVEAVLKGASALEITESGVFYGTVEIDEATVAGCFEGDLTVNGRLIIKDTGSITGAVAYRELVIEAGATLDGKVSPIKKNNAADKKPAAPVAPRTVKQEQAQAQAQYQQQPAAQQEAPQEAASAPTKKDGGLFGSRVMDAVS